VETDSVSESDSDNVDDTSSEEGDEYKSDPWAPLNAEATQQSLSEFEELMQNFTAKGFDENEAKDKAYLLILPKLRKDLQNIYLERLLWIRQLKRDPIHKKIMETRDVFVNLASKTHGIVVILTLNGCLCLISKNIIRSCVVAIFP
jgi:uncharacterized UPF0160 family protein